MPAEQPSASGVPVPPEFYTTVTPARPTAALAGEAGTWQRIVLGLAALLLLFLWWGHVGLGFQLWWVPLDLWWVPFDGVGEVLVAAGFGFAAVRPPGGILRRVLVAAACLVILLTAAAIIWVVAWNFFYYY